MKIDIKTIESLKNEAHKEAEQVADLDGKIKKTLKAHKLPVPQSFIGLHNKADYFHIQFWFEEHPIIAKGAEHHIMPTAQLPRLQMIAYHQFKTVQKTLHKKMFVKLNYYQSHNLANGLKALKDERKVTRPQFNAFPRKYQLVCEGFPIGHQSLKEQDKVMHAEERRYSKLWAKTNWAMIDFHRILSHYPVKIVKKVIDTDARIKDFKKQVKVNAKLFKGHWSFHNPNKKPAEPVDFSKIKVTPINGAEQQSLF